MAEAHAPVASDPASFEALKRVKAAESEWDQRLAAARQREGADLERLRAEADAAVRAAQAEAERARAAAVQAAKDAAEREATRIEGDGATAAADVARGAGKRPIDRKDAVLAAVLGEFAQD
ncbi:MAG TPA: hypothetical protein VMG99_07250 [Thermoplasmata archaeon]|jgi:vacuolar-type H+-ATPase subunit H|nr:hypothetical protein [Thermoplasmata archaeon]